MDHTGTATEVTYDAELRLYNDVLQEAAGVRPHDHVLDIGCGAGQTTRQAAHRAEAGSALGVDISAAALAQARRLADEEGLRNVDFACADAQTHPFPDHRFDLAISRFGTMFFTDPGAAFANTGRALRSGGRLAMVVWQAKEDNEWAVALDHLPGPFALADRMATTELLQAAGFSEVTFTDVRHPVYYGHDTEAALDWVRRFTSAKQALDRLDPPAAERELTRLRAMLTDHLRADGVWFGAAAWLVTAEMRR